MTAAEWGLAPHVRGLAPLVRLYRAAMVPERNMGRVVGLSLVGVLIVIVIGSWLLATPSDEYVLLRTIRTRRMRS